MQKWTIRSACPSSIIFQDKLTKLNQNWSNRLAALKMFSWMVTVMEDSTPNECLLCTETWAEVPETWFLPSGSFHRVVGDHSSMVVTQGTMYKVLLRGAGNILKHKKNVTEVVWAGLEGQMEYQLARKREKYPPRQDTGWESTSIYAFIFPMKKYLLSTPQTVLLEKTLESPLDCKKIKLVNPKGNQPWRFIGRTDAEAETPILWPPDAKNWLIGRDPDAGKHWRQEETGSTEDEMVGWHHQLNRHEFE